MPHDTGCRVGAPTHASHGLAGAVRAAVAPTSKRLAVLLALNLAVSAAAVAVRQDDGGDRAGVVVSSADDLPEDVPIDEPPVSAPTTVPVTTTAVTAPPVTTPPPPRPPAAVPAPTLPPAPPTTVPPPPDPGRTTGYWVVRPDGSGLRQVAEWQPNGYVNWSPDGRSLALSLDGDIVVVDVETGARRVILDGEPANPNLGLPLVEEWSPDGSWISYRRDDLFGPLSLISPDGTRHHQLPPDLLRPGTWSPDGRLMAFEEPVRTYEPATGTTRTVHPSQSSVHAWSPDGKQLLFDLDRISVVNLDGTGYRQLMSGSHGQSTAWRFDWSSTNVIGYDTRGPGGADLWTINADGSAHTKRVEGVVSPPTWSPDGRSFAFVDRTDYPDHRLDRTLHVSHDMGATQPKLFEGTPDFPTPPEWSPDGAYIGFTTMATGPPGGEPGDPGTAAARF